MKKSFILFLVIILFSSCHLFTTKEVPNEQLLLATELEKIDWKEVDSYPFVASCEEIATKEEQKECLLNFFSTTISNRLSLDTVKMYYPEIDTILVEVTIDTNATVSFKTNTQTDKKRANRKIIDSLLQKKLTNFPKVAPAIKKGIKVTSKFTIPIIVSVTE